MRTVILLRQRFLWGRSGYVTKTRLSTDLVPAIRAALQGRTFVSQTVSS